MAKIHELRYELLPHPAYSPDLALCDYYLFPNLKKSLGEDDAATRVSFYGETLQWPTAINLKRCIPAVLRIDRLLIHQRTMQR
ncbi:hypothetical protein EVAR_46983_1 [Eumeta japonica]|uniref:Histone-lysine N-methyltransferase SETMAR n=1 Tax=Eumeta variegata TaxID=151549 RepID=A0A4C1X593_EUMVA|nr:hypothetical protein EVAR_46983_1 [Eumeta japonica]